MDGDDYREAFDTASGQTWRGLVTSKKVPDNEMVFMSYMQQEHDQLAEQIDVDTETIFNYFKKEAEVEQLIWRFG
jgi:hypothetical protein